MFARVGGCCGFWIRWFGLENFCLGGLGLWIFVGEVVGVLFLFVFVVGVVLVGPQGFSGWCFRTLDQQVSQLVYELRLFW